MITLTDILLMMSLALNIKVYLDLKKSRDVIELLIKKGRARDIGTVCIGDPLYATAEY